MNFSLIGSKGSASDGDRSPSPGRRAGYSSGSDTNDKTDKSTVLVKNLYAKGTSGLYQGSFSCP